jgi:hypothetical protein
VRDALSDESADTPNPLLLHELSVIEPSFAAVQELVGFDLPPRTQEKFAALGSFLVERPLPPQLARLTPEGGSNRDWFTRVQNTAVHDVQEGLSASYYHRENIETLEHGIIDRCAGGLSDLPAPPQPITTALRARKLNFEYQAFRFALRRTLDYLAVAVAAFFKAEPRSINNLAKALRGADDRARADRVLARVESARDSLAAVLEKPNVRDRIAHWEAVDAGVVNILRDSNLGTLISIAGGGEEITPFVFSTDAEFESHGKTVIGFIRLTPLLSEQLVLTEALVFDTYRDLGVSPAS